MFHRLLPKLELAIVEVEALERRELLAILEKVGILDSNFAFNAVTV